MKKPEKSRFRSDEESKRALEFFKKVNSSTDPLSENEEKALRLLMMDSPTETAALLPKEIGERTTATIEAKSDNLVQNVLIKLKEARESGDIQILIDALIALNDELVPDQSNKHVRENLDEDDFGLLKKFFEKEAPSFVFQLADGFSRLCIGETSVITIDRNCSDEVIEKFKSIQ